MEEVARIPERTEESDEENEWAWKPIQTGLKKSAQKDPAVYGITIICQENQANDVAKRFMEFLKSNFLRKKYNVTLELAPTYHFKMNDTEKEKLRHTIRYQKRIQDNIVSEKLQGVKSLDGVKAASMEKGADGKPLHPGFPLSIRTMLSRVRKQKHPKGAKLIMDMSKDNWRSGFAAMAPKKWANELRFVAHNTSLYFQKEAERMAEAGIITEAQIPDRTFCFHSTTRRKAANMKWDNKNDVPISSLEQQMDAAVGVAKSSNNAYFFEDMNLSDKKPAAKINRPPQRMAKNQQRNQRTAQKQQEKILPVTSLPPPTTWSPVTLQKERRCQPSMTWMATTWNLRLPGT